MSARNAHRWTRNAHRWTGAVAALGGWAAAETTSAITRGPSLLDSTGRLVVDVVPRPLIDVVVRIVREADKPIVRAAVVASTAGLGAALGGRSGRQRFAFALASAAFAGWTGLRRPPRQPGHAIAAAAAGVVGATVTGPADRRSRGRVAATAVAVVGGLWWARRRLRRHEARFNAAALENDRVVRPLPAASEVAEGWPAAVPLFTPTDRFFIVDVNVGTPLIDPADWRLRLFGAVRRPMQWDLASLAKLGVEEFDAVMVCIHNQLGWHRLGNARWTGVPLSRLLSIAGPVESAVTLVTRAVDDYTISLPLGLLRRLPGYVVLGMNGGPLPARHGFPARVFVPGLYGQYTGVKWLTELEVGTEPHPDYWLQRGWPRGPVPVRPMSRIDAPTDRQAASGPVTMAGVAWAPPYGLARVEVAADDGDWAPAQLSAELAAAAWRRWRCTLDLPPGKHRLRTRAVARDGTVQEGLPRPPFRAPAATTPSR